MNCVTKEDFNSAIEHHRSIHDVRANQNAETTVKFLDLTQENTAKIDGAYRAIGGKASIKQSVTEKVGKKFKYSKENPLLEQQGQIGNYGHELIEFISRSILAVTSSMSNEEAYQYVKNWTDFPTEGLKKIGDKYGKSVDSQSEQNLYEGVKQNLLSIYKQQRVINRITGQTGQVIIKLEQIVLNPLKDIGGTIDLVAIYSDNTAAIVDYKTKIIPQSNLDAFGNILDGDKVVYQRDLEKYKLQTGEYGGILRQSYGVKSIRSITIMPIKMVVALNVRSQKYNSKITGLAFPGQDPLLEKILPFSNKTGFKSLDEFIRSIDLQLEKLNKRVKTNPEQRDELRSRITKLDNARKELLINHNLDSVLEYGKSLAKQVDDAELGNLTIPELQDLLEELRLLASIASSTFEYRKYLKENDITLKGRSADEVVEEIELKIGSMVTGLEDRVEIVKQVLFNDKIGKLIEIHTGYKINDEFGNLVPFAQEGYFGKIFYQLSQYDNPIFQTLKKILNDINYKTRQNTDKVTEEITETENKVYSWLTSSGRTFDDLIKIMLNPETDNFWSRYSKEFAQMLETLKPDELHTYYSAPEDHKTWYAEALTEKQKEIEAKKLSTKEADRELNNWINTRSLSVTNNKADHSEAWAHAKQFNNLTLKDSPKNYNENYKFIQSVPELNNYYAMFEKYNKEFRRLLGVDYGKLPNNFLPNIRKSITERVSEQGISGFSEGLQDYFKDFSIREEDKSEDSTYNSDERIPIFFLNRFRNKDNSIDIGEKSYQFGRSLIIFAKMAYHNEAVTQREAEILALQQHLSENSEQIVQSRGKNMIDQMGNHLTEKLQASDMPVIFKSFVDMYVYGIGIKPILGDKSGRAEKMLLKAKEYFTLKALGLNVVAGLGSLMSAKINSIIEGNKGIIYNKQQYNESLKQSWTDRERFLAINAFFDPMTHRLNNPRLVEEKKFGERQYGDPTMRGWVNKYVNSRMLMNVFSIGDQYIEELVTVSMSKNYYVDNLGNVRKIKNDAQLEEFKDRTIWALFSYDREAGPKLNIPEAQMANVFESFRIATQAGQSRIKGTIPEEDKAHWQNNIIMQLVMHFKSWMPGILFERFGKVRYDNRIDSIYMGKYTALFKEFSNPDKLIVKDFITKILLPKVGNLIADITTFGMLSKRRLNDKYNKELAFEKWLDENPHQKGKISFADFNEVQQKQLKSVIQELRVLLLFAALLILLLGGDDDDRFYKRYLLTRKLVALLLKTQQELSFTYSPVAFAGMIKSPLPMLSLVTDLQKTLKNTGDEVLDVIFGEERFIGGESNDKTPILSQTSKWVPGGQGFLRFLDVFSNDTQYLNTQQ